MIDIGGIAEKIGKAFDDNFTNDEERQLAKNAYKIIEKEILEIQTAYKVKLLEAESKIKSYQADVLKSEISNGEWWQKLPRPLFAYVSIFFVTSNYIIAPFITTFSSMIYPTITPPSEMWWLLTTAIGSYFITRGMAQSQRMKK